jgi:hypothetical protein
MKKVGEKYMSVFKCKEDDKRATIEPLDESGNSLGDPIKVCFNPSQYSIEKSNQFQSTSIPGLSLPISQFVNGNAKTLTLDLFFDSYEEGVDVRKYTDRIADLLKINIKLHAPPLCMFKWGSLEFIATLERVAQQFTMFKDNGDPVRAKLSVTFKEYKSVTQQLEEISPESADRTKQRGIIQGDTLSLIAGDEYGDPALWRPIAKENKIDNPRILEAGKVIFIPPLR